MKLKQPLILLFCLMLSVQLNAQDDDETMEIPPSNIVKLNISAISWKNISLQYERPVSKTISAVLGFRFQPKSGIPFKKSFVDAIAESDPETAQTIEDFRLTNIAFTPELRFYLGKKGYGRGFYVAPFYRFAKFSTSDINFKFQGNTGPERRIGLSGDFTSHTGGILFGAQWTFGKSIVFDWWLFGPHYGGGTGTLTGTVTPPLTADEQNDLRSELEQLDIPFTRTTINVNANGASMKLTGPWGGLRAGLCLGFRF